MCDFVFPIANQLINPFVIFIIGIGGGIVSNVFGIGGGVFVTPMLVMLGIPPMVAFPSQLNNSVGTNLMGFITHWRHFDVDLALAWYLFLGGVMGAFSEIWLYDWIISGETATRKLNVIYIVMLAFLGCIMLVQNFRTLKTGPIKQRNVTMRYWMIYLPWHRVFTRSRVEMSLLVPITVGFCTGLLTTILGGSISLMIMPVVTYLIGRSSPVVGGTARLAAFAISVLVTLIQAHNHAIADWLLVILLLSGSAFGAQTARLMINRIPRHYLGLFGAIALFAMCGQFSYAFLHDINKVNPQAIKGLTAVEWLCQALVSGVSWGRGLISFAYNYPMVYTSIGILMAVIMAFSLERWIRKTLNIILYTNEK